MKTLKHLFMLCLFCMISIGASAADIPNDEIWYTSSDGKVVSPYYSNAFGASIVSNTYTNGKGVIKFNGNVTSIGYEAFAYCSGLTSVTIPNSVTEIGWSAFYDCSSLTSVTIPNSVTSIGDQAFYRCSGLTSVTIPNSVTSIRSYAFYCCKGLTSVTIPNSVTSIGESAFAYCSGLTSVTIPNSVTWIGNFAFESCEGLTSVTIGNSVTYIGDRVFSRCSGLTSMVVESGNMVYDSRGNCNAIIETKSNTLLVGCMNTTIPNSVTEIGSNAFYGCSGLTSVTIPNSVTSIGWNAFDGCTSLPVENNLRYADTYLVEAVDKTLSTYNIKEGTIWIGGRAFSNCSSLTSVTIPNSVTEIGNYAFRSCSGLTSVTIPNSVTVIGRSAFENCSGLTSVTVHWKRPLSIDAMVWDGVDKQKCTLYVPEGTRATYCSAPVWMDFVNIEDFSDEPGEDVYLTVMGVNGVILQQAVETGKTYKYLLDNKKNGKIVSVTFNGEDVTADVIDGKYTTPKITGDSEIYVEYDNQPLGDTNLDGTVNVNDITKTAEIILLRAKAEMEAKAAMEAVSEP